MRFNIRRSVVTVALVAISIMVLLWLERYVPSFVVLAVLLLCTIGMLGLGVAVFAGLLAFQSIGSEEEADHRENLRRCVHLAGIGFMMVIPTLVVLIVISILHRTRF